LDTKDKYLMFPQLTAENWKSGLVEVLQHLNNLKVILHGKGFLAHELYTVVQAFITKLFLLLNK